MNIKRMVADNQNIFDSLVRSKANNRLSHAYLFYGALGVGKKELAYALACLEYCPNGGCFECDVCRSIIEGNHLNVSYIGIMEDRKLISKEQIIDLQADFTKTSLVEGRRIYIVDGIDTASLSAQNSLLKFIEDPNNATAPLGIFIATDLANVAQTIISRCSLIHFPTLDPKVIRENLKEQKVASIDAELASLLVNNSFKAQEILNSGDYVGAKTFFIDFLELKNKADAITFFIKNNKIITKEIADYFFKWLIAYYEDLFRLQAKDSLILTSFYDKMLASVAVGVDKLESDLALVLDLYSKLEYNVTAKNILHRLLTKLF